MAAERKATRQRPASARTRGTTTAQRRSRTSAARRTTGGATVAVPVITPKVKVVKVHVPTRGMSYIGDAGRLAASYLPPTDRMAFYGGLGLAAVVGLLDWPVAAAIGIGTMIARRTFRRETIRPSALRAAAAARTEGITVSEQAAEPETAGAGGRTRARATARRTATSSGSRTPASSARTSRSATAGRTGTTTTTS